MAALVSAAQASDLAQVEAAIQHAEQAGLESTTEYRQAVVVAKDLRQQQVRLGLVPLWSVCVEQSRGRKRGTVCVLPKCARFLPAVGSHVRTCAGCHNCTIFRHWVSGRRGTSERAARS